MQLDAAGDGEGHVSQYVGLGLVRVGGELGQLGPQLVGDAAPLGLGGGRVVEVTTRIIRDEVHRETREAAIAPLCPPAEAAVTIGRFRLRPSPDGYHRR